MILQKTCINSFIIEYVQRLFSKVSRKCGLTYHPLYYNSIAMIEIKTVLVLGAGASIPFGFPSGCDLVDIICTQLLSHSFQAKNRVEKLLIDKWSRSFRILDEIYGAKTLSTFADRLLHSGETSVDAFLESQGQEFMEIGKAVIAASLLPCEHQKTLFMHFVDTRRLPGKNEGLNNWYQYLWSELNAPFELFGKNLSVVTFNYDRSLEHYLFTALRNKYPDKNNEEYAEAMRTIPIIHVHGKLGFLPWECPGTDLIGAVPYDSMSDAKYHGISEDQADYQYRPAWFNNARNSINIIHEGIDKSEEFDQAHDVISKAQRLFFLGFGYHPTNLKRLNPSILNKPKMIKGTVCGLSLSRILNIERQAIGIFNRSNHKLIDTKIYNFLHDYVSLTSPE